MLKIFPKSYIKRNLDNYNQNNEKSFEQFKKAGGYFIKDTAYLKDKKFSGKLTTKSQNGDKITLVYKDGLLQSSKGGYFSKEYFRKDGKMFDVHVYHYHYPEGADNDKCIKSLEQVKFYDDRIEIHSNDFAKTAEGKRRLKLSDDDIKKQAQELICEYYKKRHADSSLKPEIKIKHSGPYIGNSYYAFYNSIYFNVDSYKAGTYEIESSIAHEGFHSIVETTRHRLDKEEKSEVLINALINKIKNCEREEILVNDQNNGIIETMNPPKMSDKMKEEFCDFAKEKLYKEYCVDLNLPENHKYIIDIIENNPDFIEQYESKEEAIIQLKNYARSHNIRYALCMCQYINTSNLPELTPSEKRKARKYMKDYIDTIEGNRVKEKHYQIKGSYPIDKNAFNGYQFCPEEVSACVAGEQFQIEKLKQRKKQMRKDATFSTQFSAYIDNQIKKSTLRIEYAKKGLMWYRKYLESLNNPQDSKLKQEIEQQWHDIEEIENKIREIPMVNIVYLCEKR